MFSPTRRENMDFFYLSHALSRRRIGAAISAGLGSHGQALVQQAKVAWRDPRAGLCHLGVRRCTDATGWEKVYAKRSTNEFSLGGCLDYNRAMKMCAEFSKLVYDTYPQVWVDQKGAWQGRPEAITAANEISARLIVPLSAWRM